MSPLLQSGTCRGDGKYGCRWYDLLLTSALPAPDYHAESFRQQKMWLERYDVLKRSR